MKKLHEIAIAFAAYMNSLFWFRVIREFIESKKIIQKLLCLVIAALLWYYNDTKRLSELHFKVPVQVDMARDFAVADMERRQVSVIVRGNAEDLRNVGQNNLSAYLRIQNPVPGSASRYPVTVTGSDIPESVKIEPTDKTLYITVERRMTKRVDIEPILEGSVDSGYFVGNCSVSPPETEISGAESIVRRIRTLKVEPISVTGYTTTFRAPAKLNNDVIRYLDVSQKNFVVEVPVFDGRGMNRIRRDIVPVNIPDALGFALESKGADIYIRGEHADQVISPNDFDLFIDGTDAPQLQKIEPGEDIFIALPVRIKNRSGAALIEIVPSKVMIKVRKK